MSGYWNENETLDFNFPLNFSSNDDDNLKEKNNEQRIVLDKQKNDLELKDIELDLRKKEIEKLNDEKLSLQAQLFINQREKNNGIKFPSLLVASLISLSSIIIYKLFIEKLLIRLVNAIYNRYLAILEWIRHLLERIHNYWISLKRRWKGKDDDQMIDQLESSPQELIYV